MSLYSESRSKDKIKDLHQGSHLYHLADSIAELCHDRKNWYIGREAWRMYNRMCKCYYVIVFESLDLTVSKKVDIT